MSCRVNYNEEGQILTVEKPNGKESTLFKKIAAHPLINSLEDALEVYKNKDTSKMYQKEENYMVAHRVNGKVYGSYKEALQQEPTKIEVGFLDNSGNFLSFKTVEPSFDVKTKEGFINKNIKEGLLSEVKVINNGKSYFKSAGKTPAGEGMKNIQLREKALLHLGWKNYRYTPNGFEFDPQIKEEPNSEESEILEKEIQTLLKTKTISEVKTSMLEESELKLRLLNLLADLGINVTSITDYLDKYNVKNGVDPSAKALADIANKVVAFQNNEIPLEELTEEVAHFIVEGWEQTEIENLLRNINKTPEYQEFADIYRNIYSKKYEGQELEQAVRREVLGKVLANSFKNNFSTEEKTGILVNIINKIKELFNSLMSSLSLNTTEQVNKDLQRFTEQVNELLYDNQLKNYLNTDNYTNNKFVLYSAQYQSGHLKGMKVELEKSLEILRETIKKLPLKDKVSDLKTRRLIKRLREVTDQENLELERQAALDLVSVADSQINYLNNIIREKKNDESVIFGANEIAAYTTLVNNLDPILTSIRANIDKNSKKYKGDKWKEISKELKQTQEKIKDLEVDRKNVYDGVIDKIIDRIILKHDKLDENFRDHVYDWINSAHKDTTLFHRWFGQISNSNDPLLGMLSEVAERTHNGARKEYVAEIKPFLKLIEDTFGFTPQRFKEFFDKGYLVNPTDYAEVDRIRKRIRAEVRKEITGEKASIEDLIKAAEKDELTELTEEQSVAYDKLYKERIREIQETYFNAEYYNQLEQKHKELNISEKTKKLLSTYSANRAEYLQEAIDTTDGTIDWSKLSEADFAYLKADKRKRKTEKDFNDKNGDLKTGIEKPTTNIRLIQDLSFVENGEVIPYFINGELNPKAPIFQTEDGLIYYIHPDNINDESVVDARTAIDLNKLDKRYTDERVEKENSIDNFLDKIADIEQARGKDAAKRFMEMNSSIMLSAEFWDSMGQEESFIEKIEKSLENKGIRDQRGVITNLKQDIRKRRNILSRYKDLNKTFELEELPREEKKQILELDASISEAYSRLSQFLEKEDNAEVERNFEVGVNQNYQNIVDDITSDIADPLKRLQTEIAFIAENSTAKANDRVSNFRYNLNAEAGGAFKSLTKTQREFVEQGGYDITSNLGRAEAIRDFAKSQIGSHYKRLAPKNIDQRLEMKEGESVKDYTERISKDPLIQVMPNYSFLEDVRKEFMNPNYNPNFEGGMQVKKGDIERTVPVINEDGTFQRNEDGSIKTTTETVNFESEKYKNEIAGDPNKQAVIQALLQLHRTTLNNYGIEDTHNLYKVPQISRKGIDRVKDIAKRATKGGIYQGMQELFTYRVDDLEYGESIGSTNVPVIPKYYTRDIENSAELSDELFFSYAAMFQQSVLYKHRNNNISEALALKEAIESRHESAIGSSTKNTMEMFNDFMDFSFFGRNEVQEYKVTIFGYRLDLTKIARNFLNYIKLRNLGLKFDVGITSYMSAEIAYQIEKYVGEILNPQATKLGTKEYLKLAKNAIGETGKMRSKAKLNILGEYFNLFQIEERFNNSNYGWFSRNLLKLPMSVHAIFNFPITPRAMMAVLHDHRVVGGRIMTFADFKQANKKTLSKKEIEAEWAKTENDVIYNYLDVSEDYGVKIQDRIKEKLLPDFQNDNYLNTKLEAITDNIKRAASQLDTQVTSEQRLAAQRHFALNYLMTHRGWLSIALSNRTKNSHYNLMSGQFEEGSYRTLYNYVTKGIKDTIKNKNFSTFIDMWNGKDLEPKKGVSVEDQLLVRRRNMRRVALDSGFLAGLSAITFALISAADEDEDNYFLQFLAYIFTRVTSEKVSTGAALPKQLYETLESPFVGLAVAKDAVFSPYYMVFGSDIIEAGKYKGMTERERSFLKVVPFMKTLYDMNNIKETRDTYYFYNKSNLQWSPISALLVAGLEDED